MSMGTDVLIRLEILVKRPDEVWSREQADPAEEHPTFESDDVREEDKTRDRRSIEIDIVAELDDGNLLTGEVEWSSNPVPIDLHFDHRDKLQRLADSGRTWAHEALDEDRSHGHLYVSAAGFDDAFQKRADGNDRLHLIDLEQMY